MHKGTIFLIVPGGSLAFDVVSSENISISHEGETLEDFVKGLLTAVGCMKCNSVNLMFSLTGAEVVETEQREMGAENYIVCEGSLECWKHGKIGATLIR